jgi:lipopolysaccharide/colanic/teichoic acid biosynthesis glycosyltransferase
MTLVGPRPEMPFIVDRYGDQHRRRLQVVPGITGLWQLSADRALPIHENMEYDLYYIRNRTFFMDIAILLHTLLFAIGGGV